MLASASMTDVKDGRYQPLPSGSLVNGRRGKRTPNRPPAFAVWCPPQRLEPLIAIPKRRTRQSSHRAEKGISVTPSLALSWGQTRSPWNFDIRFRLLLALPIAALAVAVLSNSDGSAGGMSSAFLEVIDSRV